MRGRHHYPAALYELVHRGTPGDLAFYRHACSSARSVLELGCGYGRVLAELMDPDVTVVGLDNDPELLALAEARCAAARTDEPGQRKQRVELVLGDMTDFDLSAGGSGANESFDRILIPYSGLYCLLSDEASEACFRHVARHLRPGGMLVFDAYVADRFHAETDPEDHTDERLDPIVAVEHEGKLYDVFERSRWQRAEQRLDVTYEYIPRHGGEVLQGSIAHRYLLEGQLAALLERAGLSLASIAGDWHGGALHADSEFFVAAATQSAGMP